MGSIKRINLVYIIIYFKKTSRNAKKSLKSKKIISCEFITCIITVYWRQKIKIGAATWQLLVYDAYGNMIYNNNFHSKTKLEKEASLPAGSEESSYNVAAFLQFIFLRSPSKGLIQFIFSWQCSRHVFTAWGIWCIVYPRYWLD